MGFKLGDRGKQIRLWHALAIAILIALLGAGSAWQQDKQVVKVSRPHALAAVAPAEAHEVPLIPDSLDDLAAFPVNTNGPLEPPDKKAARLAEADRQTTRELVDPDRSNVDCSLMKCVALTFDDGPSTQFTPQLVNTLKQRRAVATFFVVGSRVYQRINILQQVVAGQNEIGNHTWSHANLTRLKDQDIASEITRTNDVITAAIGRPVIFMRPPSGAYDPRIAALAHMPLALWSVDPKDWRDRDPELIYERTVGGAGQGKVILLHDIYATTIQATPRIIDELQRQGYVLVTMSELFGITPQNAPIFAGQVFRSR